jgi:hypothetical protein
MFRRKKRTQLAKNIIAERERVIEFGEDAPYSLGAAALTGFWPGALMPGGGAQRFRQIRSGAEP